MRDATKSTTRTILTIAIVVIVVVPFVGGLLYGLLRPIFG